MKVVLWILGIIGAIVLLLIVGGYFLGKSMTGSVEDANKFAENATKQECVTEMANQLRACDGMSCMMKSSMFVATCMAKAKGDMAEVCEAVPDVKDSDGMNAWRGEFCSAHDLKETACEMGMGTIAGFCSAAKQNSQ